MLFLLALLVTSLAFSRFNVQSAPINYAVVKSSGQIVNSFTLNLSVSPSPSIVNQTLTLRGTYENSRGQALAKQPVLIQYSNNFQNWFNLTVETDVNGKYSTELTPRSAGFLHLNVTAPNANATCEQLVANSIVSTTTELETLIPRGGVIYIAAGVYYPHDPISLSNNSLIIGSKDKTIIRVPSNRARALFYGYNVSNIVITNLTMNGNSQPTSQSGNSALAFENSTTITIYTVKILNLDKEGILLNSCYDINVENSIVENVWTGVVIRDTKNASILANFFNWTAGDGIYVTTSPLATGSTNVTLDGNTLTKIGDTGIDVSTPYNGTSKDIKIYNNTYLSLNALTPSTEKNGIGITLSRCENAVVKDNDVSSAKGGLLIGNYVSNATISSNSFSKFSSYGIWVVTPTDLCSNIIRDGSTTGIRINPSKGDFRIQSNTISNVSIAISWIGSAPGIQILNNTIQDPTLCGIWDGANNYWTSGASIIGNLIVDGRTNHKMQYGIFQGSSKVTWTINSNVIEGAVVQPMYLASKTNLIL
jgi:hypothetical protein